MVFDSGPGSKKASDIFGPSFADVYQNESDFRRDEWDFCLKHLDQGLPDYIDDKGTWQLFPERSTEQIIVIDGTESNAEPSYLPVGEKPQSNQEYPLTEIYDLIAKAKPEIERLYSGMRSIVGTFSPQDKNEEKFREAALTCFDLNEFQVIKREHVKEYHPYYRSGKDVDEDETQNYDIRKRDFIGRLCQIIISGYFPSILPEPTNPTRNCGIKFLYEKVYSKV